MEVISLIIIVIGLCLYETVSSIGNAVINAEVLDTRSQKAGGGGGGIDS